MCQREQKNASEAARRALRVWLWVAGVRVLGAAIEDASSQPPTIMPTSRTHPRPHPQRDLRRQGSNSQVYIVGLAYDFCVGYTALDAKSLGFTTYVVDDCTRSVKQQSKVLQHLEEGRERV